MGPARLQWHARRRARSHVGMVAPPFLRTGNMLSMTYWPGHCGWLSSTLHSIGAEWLTMPALRSTPLDWMQGDASCVVNTRRAMVLKDVHAVCST